MRVLRQINPDKVVGATLVLVIAWLPVLLWPG